MTEFDWSDCPEVEQIPGKISGVPILVGTRVQAEAVTGSYEAVFSAEGIAAMFRLDVNQIKTVISYGPIIPLIAGRPKHRASNRNPICGGGMSIAATG